MNRVCFVAPLARPILEPQFRCDFGGAEVRAVNFASGLQTRDAFDVSMVLRSYRREPTRTIRGLTIFFEETAAPVPRTRDLRRDHTFLWNFIQMKFQKVRRSWNKRRTTTEDITPSAVPFFCELPVDVVCVFGVHHYAANLIKSAQASGKLSILFLAADLDVDERYQRDFVNTYRQQSHMCRFAIENAHHIVAQTESQQSMLRERFGRTSSCIRNPIDLSCPMKGPQRVAHGGDYVLWVGRADTYHKRADKFLQIARSCPEVKFVGIMNKRDQGTHRRLLSEVPANVEVVERVPYAEVERYFSQASALLSTSDATTEGFPNTFLQAGKFAVPVLSLNVDPGEMLSRHQCGELAGGDVETMVKLVSRFWQHRHSARHQLLSGNALRYVQTYHALEDRIGELDDLLNELLPLAKAA